MYTKQCVVLLELVQNLIKKIRLNYVMYCAHIFILLCKNSFLILNFIQKEFKKNEWKTHFKWKKKYPMESGIDLAIPRSLILTTKTKANALTTAPWSILIEYLYSHSHTHTHTAHEFIWTFSFLLFFSLTFLWFNFYNILIAMNQFVSFAFFESMLLRCAQTKSIVFFTK